MTLDEGQIFILPTHLRYLLIFSDLTFDGTEYLLGIEAHSLLKHPFDLPDVLDMLKNITIDDYVDFRLRWKKISRKLKIVTLLRLEPFFHFFLQIPQRFSPVLF